MGQRGCLFLGALVGTVLTPVALAAINIAALATHQYKPEIICIPNIFLFALLTTLIRYIYWELSLFNKHQG